MTATLTGVVVGALTLVAAFPWWAARVGTRCRVVELSAEPRVAPREDPGRPGRVDVSVLLELLAAAMRSGAGVPRALQATGAAVGGDDGTALARAADALRLGASWETAWRGTPGRLAVVHRALRGAWVDGAAPGASLRAAGDELQRERRAAARTAAALLAVRLVLPLGACFLPAFVLVGLAPVLLALGLDLLSG